MDGAGWEAPGREGGWVKGGWIGRGPAGSTAWDPRSIPRTARGAQGTPARREELQGAACPLLQPPSMASPMRNLLTDLDRYVQSFRVFLERSTEHQSMQGFVERHLPDVIASIGNGKSTINVLSIGGGAGTYGLQYCTISRGWRKSSKPAGYCPWTHASVRNIIPLSFLHCRWGEMAENDGAIFKF
ncbi:uncharacterized protein LOC102074954 isoform X3 [Zonotrichia albicollis]|uniref:uncharacterized protein LOC102074954 isoform X3 n=1 Tax=Zonotrichia albicollis TaxID=44394 RepID=UPI003D80C168